MEGYNDFVRNTVINYCSATSKDIAFRYAIQRADLTTAVKDHDYLDKPFTEYWVDTSVNVSM